MRPVEALGLAVLALLVICASSLIGPKIRIASPLLLVAIGIGVGFLPVVPAVHIEPEWILAGVLPPLLYSASVSMPSMNFRREFGAISSLAVLLVVASAVLLGLLFWWLIPGIGLAWGIALGAIVSPTDAVATSIVKSAGVAPRIVAILEGEGLLNDASALVILRTAIAAAAAAVSAWDVLGGFVFSIVAAVLIGILVGRLDLAVRSRITNRTVNTALSFVVPFVASLPAEAVGASGLVAAVATGLITGRGAPRRLSPIQRVSDTQNWRSIEFVLEGTIFLTMGLELHGLVLDIHDDAAQATAVIGIAFLALAASCLIRGAFVAPLLAYLRARAARGERLKPTLQQYQDELEHGRLPERAGRLARRQAESAERAPRRGPNPGRRMDRLLTRVRRTIADVDYFLAVPLTWRDGTVVVWAGMRGAVTVAAAQTLPPDTPHRALLVILAFLVAGLSLVIQGGTLGGVVRLVKPATGASAEEQAVEREALLELLTDTATRTSSDAGVGISDKQRQLTVMRAQRDALLDARDDGLFESATLTSALVSLDADEISLELRGGPDG
jgi:CPA1 family monovalent cation:H+ antiporter